MTALPPTAAQSPSGAPDELPLVTHVVVSGGPSGGKTTALAAWPPDLEARGFGVLTTPEAATTFIVGGFPILDALADGDDKLWTLQIAITRLQLAVFKTYDEMARKLARTTGRRYVVLHDRGICDNAAYIGPELFEQLLDEVGITMHEARDAYDMALHLVTAADGAEDHYSCENNAARTESPELARELDAKTRRAWHGHEHLKMIDNSTDFDGKLARGLREILNVLAAPPTEYERKFLLSALPTKEQLADAAKIQIEQTYLLTASPDVELRIRRSTQGRHLRFSRTIKEPLPDGGRNERGNTLNNRTYQELLHMADPEYATVSKTRRALSTRSHYLEIDEFHVPDGVVLLEVEVANLADPLELPSWLSDLIIEDVTHDPQYKTRALARQAKLQQAHA